MTAPRYSHFFIYTEPTSELGELLTREGKTVSEHRDELRGAYYYVYMNKPMTLKEVKKLTGCVAVYGDRQDNETLLAITRSSIALARKEYEELIRKGKMIMQVLNEEKTSQEILSRADRRALTAYKKSLAR